MKSWKLIIATCIILLAIGIFWIHSNHQRRENLQIANPASVHCVQQGYKLEIKNGTGYCINSDGKTCEEWAYYRGKCFFKKPRKCVPANCCHASSCVWENARPNCSGTICTMECRRGSIDCGAGQCGVVNGKCEVIWNEK